MNKKTMNLVLLLAVAYLAWKKFGPKTGTGSGGQYILPPGAT